MIYVVSNIHGNYEKFKQLLEKISFSEDDIMYILGDLVDFGDESMALIEDVSVRMNVYAVSGEHDATAYKMLSGFDDMLKNGKTPDMDFITEMQTWAKKGGQPTLDAFRELDDDMKEGVLDYLSDMAAYEIAETDDGREFLLVHAGIADFEHGKELDDYAPEAFYTEALDMDKQYFKNAYVVVGHIPTAELGEPKGKILRRGKNIAIDCGAYKGGALACLCLDTDKEYYI